jgi:hypothetical protein
MRPAPGRATLAAMKITTSEQCVILDAAFDRPVIHGTLTAPSGAQRDLHGWLELNPALDFRMGAGPARVQFELGNEETLHRFPVPKLEDGCERQTQLFVEGSRAMPVQRA